MADKTDNATLLRAEGVAEKVALYRVFDIDTGDTMDVSDLFSKIKAAATVAAGTPTAVNQPTIAGAVLTFAASSQTDETLYVLVIGDTAS